MNMEVQLERLEEADRAIVMARRASDALRALGKITMPDNTAADEQLEGVNRSEVASVFAFFGEVIDQHATRAYDLIDSMGIEIDKELAPRRRAA